MLTIAQGLTPLKHKAPTVKEPSDSITPPPDSITIPHTRFTIVGRTPVHRQLIYDEIKKRGGIVHKKVGKTTEVVLLGKGVSLRLKVKLANENKKFLSAEDFALGINRGIEIFTVSVK